MPQDPGIGAGTGGFFASLFNPGLATRVAQHITPNPNPLAQQGGPAAPGSVDSLGNPSPSGPPPGSNLAPAAATQGDPINAANIAKLSQPDPSYAADMMRYDRMNRLSDSLNRDLQGVAAGFGTAQQQASKQAALRGDGGVGDSLGALAKIQGMQDTTVADNEHARFMANAHIFAQTLSQSLGRPVSDQEATTIMNSPDLMKAFGTAAGANATTTGTEKDAEAATREWVKANPNATPQQIADYKAGLIATGMGGGTTEDQQYRAYAMAEKAAGRVPDDIITWKNQHAVALKEADATAVNIANAKKVLPGVNTAITNMTQIADGVLSRSDILKGIMADKNKARWANSIMKADPKDNTALNAVQSGGLTQEEAAVIGDIAQLHNMNYRGAFSGEGGVKGIRSQVEADRVSRAADQLGNFSVDPDTYIKNLGRLKGTYNSALANASGEAQALEQIPESARYRLDPSYFSGGANAPPNLPEWAKVKTISSKADWDKLPNGQAYKAPGSEHGNKILIKGYEQQALDEGDGG